MHNIIKNTRACARAVDAMAKHARAARDAYRQGDPFAEQAALTAYERARKRYARAYEGTRFPWERAPQQIA